MSAFDDDTLRQLEALRAKAGGGESISQTAEREMAGQSIEPSRRFTDKPELNPGAVRGLAPDHPAMVGSRTLFPSTVVEVTEDEPSRLLVSGANNRKLGDVVAKGRFKGYALYGLSLEERATCPDDCAARAFCFGNGMQMARRHRIGDPDVFYDRLGMEVADLLGEHEGLLVRLHVLGDFPSVDYVANWADLLEEWEQLAVYGYTARRSSKWGGDEIGDAIEAVKERFPERFRIRWSSAVSRPDGAFIVDEVPTTSRIGDAVVCPAQTDATACCATCGLCWEPSFASNAIAFIKHGPKSIATQAETEIAAIREPSPEVSGAEGAPVRQVQALSTIRASAEQRGKIGSPPIVRVVDPANLRIEGAYQRDLSKKSIKLLRKIVAGWDWAKFKPPICAERDHGLVIIDGQHTAIAAATLGITHLPVMVVGAALLAARAESFVAHNRDRIAMSAFQIFHASVVAGDPVAVSVLQAAQRTGAIIPRSMPARGKARPGQIIDIRDVLNYAKRDGIELVERIFRVAVAAEAAPLGVTATRSLRMLLTAPYFAAVARMPDSRIANALKSLPDFEAKARLKGAEDDQGQVRAGAVMIAAACGPESSEAAA